MNNEHVRAYPLEWPSNWRRTPATSRFQARFRSRNSYGYAVQGLTVSDGIGRVLEQLRHMGVDRNDTVISTNLRTRLDGLPRGDAPKPADPGVAVYWRRHGEEPRCMAIDRYDNVADNLAAIAATLESMRAIERHGGAVILDKAFAGFAALPSPFVWWQVLGLDGPNATRDEIERAHRRLAMSAHPDRGGDVERMSDINRARDQGLRAV